MKVHLGLAMVSVLSSDVRNRYYPVNFEGHEVRMTIVGDSACLSGASKLRMSLSWAKFKRPISSELGRVTRTRTPEIDPLNESFLTVQI